MVRTHPTKGHGEIPETEIGKAIGIHLIKFWIRDIPWFRALMAQKKARKDAAEEAAAAKVAAAAAKKLKAVEDSVGMRQQPVRISTNLTNKEVDDLMNEVTARDVSDEEEEETPTFLSQY